MEREGFMESNIGSAQLFTLNPGELEALQLVKEALRKLLRVPDLTPTSVIGIGRMMSALSSLPLSTEGVDVACCLTLDGEQFESSTQIHVSATEIAITLRGQLKGEKAGVRLDMRLTISGDKQVNGDLMRFARDFDGDAACAEESLEYAVRVFDASR